MRISMDRKRLAIILLDLVLIIISYILAFLIRFELAIPHDFVITMLTTAPVVILVRMSCFWLFGLYKGIWYFASTEDLLSILKATATSSVFIVLSLYLINQFSGYPRSIFFIDWLLVVISIGGARLSIRLSKEILLSNKGFGRRTLIVGAGHAGDAILRAMINNQKLDFKPIGLIDDSPEKLGKKIHGIEVLGGREDIPRIVKKHRIDEIIISIPSATNDQIKEILSFCIESGAKFKTIPTLSEIMDGKANITQIRDVEMEDLLGRAPLETDLERIRGEFEGKTVLVTGAGGSIGKELCKQISKFNPEKIILFDRAENSVFYIDRELRWENSNLECIPIVADVSDRRIASRVFIKFKPNIVFHAAAHKHVPLMEINAGEVVRNNVLGTKVIADLAIENKADKFIFISTDKAVNPTNFMGATKKFGERYIAGVANKSTTKFMSVRFGNVIGSTGSVARLFKEQIQLGMPLTVTHPDISRFLMTIPEAVQLILQAAAMGGGEEIFVLDMGKPIKIMDLAKTMIRLSGYEPERDIPIIITGLRRGEKMEEELFDEKNEKLNHTEHKKIYVVEAQNSTDNEDLINAVTELEKSMQNLDEKELIEKFQQMLDLKLADL